MHRRWDLARTISGFLLSTAVAAGCAASAADEGVDASAAPTARMAGEDLGTTVEPGAQPIAAATVCGDGVLESSERCDDGNNVSGDGCTGCRTDTGYVCTGYPQSTCAITCGDGVLATSEECDDGNTAADDGCSPTCAIEPGTTCADPYPSAQFFRDPLADCYDPTASGVVVGDPTTYVLPAQYDLPVPPNNYLVRYMSGVADYDGDNTQPPPNLRYRVRLDFFDKNVSAYRLTTPANYELEADAAIAAHALGPFPFEVTPVGGLQVAVPDSVCFDNAGGPLWFRLDVPTVCVPSCGDGKVNGSEHCDDGNLVDGDGCSTECLVEPGYLCPGYSPSVCAITCGDSVLAPSEGCDDGNTAAGDGCSPSCAVETGYACAASPAARFISVAPNPDCFNAPATLPPQDAVSLPPALDVTPPVAAGTYVVRYVAGATDYKYSVPDPANPSTSPRYGVWVALVDELVSYVLVGSQTLFVSAGQALAYGQSLPSATFTVTNPAGVQAATLEPFGGKCGDNALGLVTIRLDQPTTCAPLCVDDAADGTDTGCTADAPYCQLTGAGGGTCQPCLDDATDGADAGCAQDAPFCVDLGAGEVGCLPCEPSDPSDPTCDACGDGLVAGAEACDDGNAADDDGCSASCTVDDGYTCTGTAPSVCKPEPRYGVDGGGGCRAGDGAGGGALTALGLLGVFGLARRGGRRGRRGR